MKFPPRAVTIETGVEVKYLKMGFLLLLGGTSVKAIIHVSLWDEYYLR